MNGLLVFNHHSLPFTNKNEADSTTPEFLKICIRCKNLGLNTILVDDSVDGNWFRLELSNGYYWQDWYTQHSDNANRDLARVFRSIKTNQPLSTKDDISNNVDLYEAEFQGEIDYSALRSASWNESPLASFPSSGIWKNSPLSVMVRTLNENGEIEENSSEIMNFYSLEIFEILEPILLSARNESIRQGSDMYNRWDKLFPSLKNCGKVREQLVHWSASNTVLTQVMESLTVLNTYSKEWLEGDIENFSYDSLRKLGLNHKVSGESDSVKRSPFLRKEREFWLPSGVKNFFESHIKISNGYRIHFYPDPTTKSIFIGYIGTHLKL